MLPLCEKQLASSARVLLASPGFVFLDRAGTTFNRGQLRRVLNLIAANSVRVIADGESEEAPRYSITVLELVRDGGWQWKALRAGRREMHISPTE